MDAIDTFDDLAQEQPTRERRLAFIDEYMHNGFNATEAYQKVFKCGHDSARKHAGRVLNDPDVQDYLCMRRQEAYKRIGISHERIMLELQRLALVNTEDFYDPDTGALRPIHQIPEDARRAIQGVKVDRDGCKVGYEIEGKKGALELLAKIGAMVVERQEISSKNETTVKTSPEVEERVALLLERISKSEVFQ
jgi:hypothetical protein